MKLSNFKKQVNPTILQRGESYHQSKAVYSLEEISSGKWEAQVEGTEPYTVNVTLSGNTIASSYCDIDTYKHEIAVFFR